MRAIWWWLLVVGMVGGAPFWRPSRPEPKRAASWQRGKAVYEERCAKCHGEQGQGKLGRADRPVGDAAPSVAALVPIWRSPLRI
jgi:mono/diheme cytochrome c family protein